MVFELYSDAEIKQVCTDIFLRHLRLELYAKDQELYSRQCEEKTSYNQKSLKASVKAEQRNDIKDLVSLQVESEIKVTIREIVYEDLYKTLIGHPKIASNTKKVETLQETADFQIYYNLDQDALVTIAAIGFDKYSCR
jgi:hypothetical protein